MKKSVALTITFVLLSLLAVRCSPTPTATLVPPTVTSTSTRVVPTPSAVPSTPTPLVVGVGDTASTGPWRITAIQLGQESSIESTLSRLRPAEGYIIQVIRFRLENTASMTSTLELDLRELTVVDAKGGTYPSDGVGFGEGPMDRLAVMYAMLAGRKVEVSGGRFSGSDDREGLFDLNTSGESGTLRIRMPGDSTVQITFAFTIPVDCGGPTLHWPGLVPIDLREVPLS